MRVALVHGGTAERLPLDRVARSDHVVGEELRRSEYESRVHMRRAYGAGRVLSTRRAVAQTAAVAPGSSSPGKKKAISARAVSAASEPCTAFFSTSVPNWPRIVSRGAFFES